MRRLFKSSCVVMGIAMVLLAAGCSKNDPVAKILSSKGEVKTKGRVAKVFEVALKDAKLFAGDAIRTEDDSEATLEVLNDKSQIVLSSNTFLEMRKLSEKEIRQNSGIAIYKISPQNKKLKIQTAQGVATVLGTVFRVDVTEKNTTVTVEEGKVGFSKGSGAKEIVITPGNRFSTSFAKEEIQPVDPAELESLFNTGGGLKPIINPR